MTAPHARLTDRIRSVIEHELDRRRGQIDGQGGLQEVTLGVRLRNGEITRVIYSDRSEGVARE